MTKKKVYEYRFEIDAYTPETMPMARLAEYLQDLSILLGHFDTVHFVRLEGGSTVPVVCVEQEAFPKVQARLKAVRSDSEEAPPEAIRAYRSIDSRLEQDNAIGNISESGDQIIRFPGRTRPKPLMYGPFNQIGDIDGVVIRIGGESDPVPVHLEEMDRVHICSASRAIAKQMGNCLFGPIVRVHGIGRWKRTEESTWEMLKFKIESFEELDQASLGDTVARMRKIESPLGQLEDPAGEVLRFRKESDKK